MMKQLVTIDGSRYEVVGECPVRSGGKWATVDPGSCWVPRDIYEAHPDKFDLDPRGNPSGVDGGDRWCLSTIGGGVQLREGDRVVVLRPSAGAETKLVKVTEVVGQLRWNRYADGPSDAVFGDDDLPIELPEFVPDGARGAGSPRGRWRITVEFEPEEEEEER
jgi:hypothetical protein